MEIGSGPPIESQMFAMKKATEVQEQAVVKVLESSMEQTKEVEKAEVAKITEKGQKIDLMA